MQRKPEPRRGAAAAVYTMGELLFRISSLLMSLLRPINGPASRVHIFP